MTKLSIHLEKKVFKAKRFLKKEYNKIIYIVKFFKVETKKLILYYYTQPCMMFRINNVLRNKKMHQQEN